MNTPIRFNINENVKVKLTPIGERILRRACDSWKDPVVKDVEGYSTFQMWELMMIFGPRIHNGCEPPFETEIVINEYTS